MATDGHAPTHGAGNALHLLGNGVCPECRRNYNSISQTPDLKPTERGDYQCPECGSVYPLANRENHKAGGWGDAE